MPSVPREAAIESLLRPYRFHGIDVTLVDKTEALAECFLCGKEKMYLSSTTGLWGCKVCGESGNPLTFLRKLHRVSVSTTRISDLEELAVKRYPLKAESLAAWGICRSSIDGVWLVPGYNTAGTIVQIYRYTRISDNKKTRMALLPTPQMGEDNEGHKHGYFMPSAGWDQKKRRVVVLEGIWDGIALWESLKTVREGWGGEYEKALSESASLLSEYNILAAPSASVFFPSWMKLLSSRDIFIVPQYDYPKLNERTGKVTQASGDGMKRLVLKLVDDGNKINRMTFIDWALYNTLPETSRLVPTLKDGYDCRDWMGESNDKVERTKSLMKLVRPIPAVWFEDIAKFRPSAGMSPLPCSTWTEVISAWKEALYWRDTLDYALSVMLSVAVSTVQVGSQLFLRVIGAPGSAKTRMCDAMLTSKNCYPLETLKGFHSGWKDASGDDFSLISRINGKTLITPEGDVIVSSPFFQEIMSQQRRIFDGTTGASYKNQKEDKRYTGLRTPWIIAGTKSLLDTDQARLGDRFLTIYLDTPEDDERSNILQKVGLTALQCVKQTSNGETQSSLNPKMAHAFRVTGGYVDYLRANSESLIGTVVDKLLLNSTKILSKCAQLAEHTAWMRIQLPKDPNMDSEIDIELPTRLTEQFIRLACCMTVVMNKDVVDEEVISRVKQVALDTAAGTTFRLAEMLYLAGRVGYTDDSLKMRVDIEPKRLNRQLRMMKAIGLVEYYRNKGLGTISVPKWRLTQKAFNLIQAVKES